MKTNTTTKANIRGAIIPALTLLGLMFITSSVNAATVVPYFADFEVPNDNLFDWTEVDGSVGSGTGNSFILFANGSNGGYVEKSGANNIILYQDFDYNPLYKLSFDMQAQADTLFPGAVTNGNTAPATLESSSGVIISFFKADTTLAGSLTLSNTSNISTGTAGDVGPSLEHYVDYLSTWASNAGVTDPVATFRLEFFAAAQTDPNDALRRSTSSVWFDNVKVIPLPASLWLLGSGLIGLLTVARKKKV